MSKNVRGVRSHQGSPALSSFHLPSQVEESLCWFVCLSALLWSPI